MKIIVLTALLLTVGFMTINATICDYNDCTCSGSTVSCRCQNSNHFELTGSYKNVPSNLTKFHLEHCGSANISYGIFTASSINSITIRDSVDVSIQYSAIVNSKVKFILFHNLTLKLEERAMLDDMTSMEFNTVNFTKYNHNITAISGRIDRISFVNCDIYSMSMFYSYSKPNELVIDNSKIHLIPTNGLKHYIGDNMQIHNSVIDFIETGAIAPRHWGGNNFVQYIELKNNTIGVLDKDFFYADGAAKIMTFRFIDNTVGMVKAGAFGGSLENCRRIVHIQNNSFSSVESQDTMSTNFYADSAFISGNRFHCTAVLCRGLDQNLPVLKGIDFQNKFETLMFNNSHCIDDAHKDQTPIDVFGHFVDADECFRNFNLDPVHNVTNCTEHCNCFDEHAVCSCPTDQSSITPKLHKIPKHISHVTITNCQDVQLTSGIDYIANIRQVVVKNVGMVTVQENFPSYFYNIRSLKFKNLTLVTEQFSFAKKYINTKWGEYVVTFDNVKFGIIAENAFDESARISRLKIMNSDIKLVQMYLAKTSVIGSIIIYNTTIEMVDEKGFYFENVENFRMISSKVQNLTSQGLHVAGRLGLLSFEIKNSQFGIIQKGAFMGSDIGKYSFNKKVVFSDNAVQVLMKESFKDLWINYTNELVFTNNAINCIGEQTNIISAKNVVEHNQLVCDISLCSTLAKYFPYVEKLQHRDFFAQLAFNQSTCISSSSADFSSKTVHQVYGSYNNRSECEQSFRNGTIIN